MEYNNYGIFVWNKDNLTIDSSSNIYNNVFLHTGVIKKGTWENCIVTKKIEDKHYVVKNSNHFICGIDWGDGYNNAYKIYDNLINNYLHIKSQEKETNMLLYNDEIYFYMLDAFSFSNSGHNLSTILNMTEYILKNNIKNILIYKNYKETHNYKLIQMILTEQNFIELDENTIYNVKNIIIIYPEIYNIFKHQNIIDTLKNKIIEGYSTIYEECKNKNIILIKSNRNKNVMLEHTRVSCETLLLSLENEGFINLIPEEIDIFKLCIYILYANKIVFSGGSIIYTNKIFIDTKSKLYGLCIYNKNQADFNGLQNIKYLYSDTNVLTYDEYNRFYNEIVKN